MNYSQLPIKDLFVILNLLFIATVILISPQKKYDLSDMTIRSLEDSEGILNAFEIKGKLKS